MPEGKYGPGGKWIHDRAHSIMEDGETPKDVAYAVATQQAHKVGKSPESFRTSEGVQEAKAKYDEPKSHYDKIAMTRVSSLVSLLSKFSSDAGQDLRTPMMNTRMPTDDSKQHAKSLLDKGQAAVELGPAPSIKQLAPQGPSIQEAAVKMPSTKGSIPKIAAAWYERALIGGIPSAIIGGSGAAMSAEPGLGVQHGLLGALHGGVQGAGLGALGVSPEATVLSGSLLGSIGPRMVQNTMQSARDEKGSDEPLSAIERAYGVKESMAKIAEDPIVKYLKKNRQALETNIDNMEIVEREPELTAEDPHMCPASVEGVLKKQNDELAELFNTYSHKPPSR